MTNTELVRQLKTASVQADDMRLRDFGYLFKTAAEAIERLIAYNEFWEKSAITAKEIIDKELPKWISVKERLPEPETEVLAAFDDGYVWAMWQKWSLTDEYEEGESPFDYYKDVGAGLHTVTHWMPLPEPPKEVNT